jgi:sphinganine-1-phosphate aldolase
MSETTTTNILRTAEHIFSFICIVYFFKRYVISKHGRDSWLRSTLTTISPIAGIVKNEARDTVQQMFKNPESKPTRMKLPKEGITTNILEKEITAMVALDGTPPSAGYTFAYVYTPLEKEAERIAQLGFRSFEKLNALNPSAFPSLRKMEVEIVEMCKDMTQAPDVAVGSVTAGGSESIFIAVKAAREYKRLVSGNAHLHCALMVPQTAHPAFWKAAHALDVEIITIPCDATTQVALVKEFETLYQSNVCLMVVSAPSYPSGVLDPVSQIAEFGVKKKTLVHVDACVGGFLLPFLPSHKSIQPWNFSASEGVTSMSLDPHKFGFTSKGCSVVLFRDAKVRQCSYFSMSTWPGGLFVSPSMLGTRPAGPIASAWAVMRWMGWSGYRKSVGACISVSDRICKALRDEVDLQTELEIVGEPCANVIAFKSKRADLNVFAIADAMETCRPWHLERNVQPDSIHFTIMPPHVARVEELIQDLKLAVAMVKEPGASKRFSQSGSAKMYGTLAVLPEVVTDQFLVTFLDEVYRVSE